MEVRTNQVRRRGVHCIYGGGRQFMYDQLL